MWRVHGSSGPNGSSKPKHASHLKHTLGEMCALTEADEGSATILVGQHGRLCIDSLAPSPHLEVLLRCPWQGVRDIPANRTACSKRIARTWLPGITERLSPQRQPGGLGGMSVPRGAKPPETARRRRSSVRSWRSVGGGRLY